MAITTGTLAVPAIDGVGASLDCNLLSATRTLLVDGGGSFSGTLIIQGSNDNVNFEDLPGARFDGGNNAAVVVLNANRYLRVRRFSVTGGAAPVAYVIAEAVAGVNTATLAIPAADGVGAGTLLSAAAGTVLTFLAHNADASGIIIVEGSVNSVDWAPILDLGKLASARILTIEEPLTNIRVRRIQAGSTTPVVTVGQTFKSGAAPVVGLDPTEVVYGSATGTIEQSDYFTYIQTGGSGGDTKFVHVTNLGIPAGGVDMVLGVQGAIGFVGSATNRDIGFLVNNGTKMYINTTGYVGINNNSPAARLHIDNTSGGNIAMSGGYIQGFFVNEAAPRYELGIDELGGGGAGLGFGPGGGTGINSKVGKLAGAANITVRINDQSVLKCNDVYAVELMQIVDVADAATLWFNEKNVSPNNPTQDTVAKMYLKSDKLVVMFNNGGAIKYWYLDLTSAADQSWIYTAVAP